MIFKILNYIFNILNPTQKWKYLDKNSPDFNKDGIEWRYDHNGRIEVNRYSLHNDPEFKKQIEACNTLMKLLKNEDGTYKSINI